MGKVALVAQTAGVIARGAKAAAARLFGPVRPPAKKPHRKKGLEIAALEADDLFAKGNWSEIETVVAKRQSCWPAFSTSVDRFLKESRTFRGSATN